MEISYDEAKCIEGYLEKKSHNMLGSWQKRYFQIKNGREMTYREKKKSTEIKSRFDLVEITMPESADKKVFRFFLDQKEFRLKADSEAEKNRWISAITLLKNKLIEMGEGDTSKLEVLKNIITNQDNGYANANTDSYYFPNKNNDTTATSYSYNDSNANAGSYTNQNEDIQDNTNANLNPNLNANLTVDVNINNPNNNYEGINANPNLGLNSILDSNVDQNLNSNIKEEPNNYQEVKPEPNNYIEVKPEVIPEAKPVVIPEVKPVVIPETKPVVIPETKPVVIPEVKPEPNNYSENKPNINYNINIKVENDKNNYTKPIESNISSNIQKENKPIQEKVNSNKKKETIINVGSLHPASDYEEKTSLELLKLKGIDKLIDINDPVIKSRIFHEYLYKKNYEDDGYTKKWFFILSARPVFDKEYKVDDIDLDPNNQKQWLKFNRFMFFIYEHPDESDKNYESVHIDDIENIEKIDKDGKYFIVVSNDYIKFIFFSFKKDLRDKWFEVLNNATRTVREYEASVTKSPRNVEFLNTFFLRGEKDFYQKIEKEIIDVLGDYKKNLDSNRLEFYRMANFIIATLDGCNSNNPPKTNLIKAYSHSVNKQYLEILKMFWDKKYSEVNIFEIMNISMMLFNLWEKSYLLNVDDINLYKNAKAFMDIYIKQTYRNILSVIENILTDDRERKALTDNDGKYYLKSPSDLFELLQITFDFAKTYQNKYLYESILNLFYYCIYQYLLGIGAFLTNLDIIMEKEFLLAICNDCITIQNLTENLIKDVQSLNISNELEIDVSLNLENIIILLNKVSQKSIANFIYLFSDELEHYYTENINKVNMAKIVSIATEMLAPYYKYMKSPVSEKANKEMLKLIIYHYITLLLKPKPPEKPEGEEGQQNQNTIQQEVEKLTIEQIRKKIKKDRDILSDSFERIIGKSKTESCVKILDDLQEFLNSNADNTSSPCLALREYIGPSFDSSMVKDFINLRTDLEEQDKNNLNEKIKEILDNYEDKKNNKNEISYFKIREIEKKRESYDEDEDDEVYIKGENIFNRDEFNYDEILNDNNIQEDIGGNIYEGNLDHKIIINWKTFYAKLKTGEVYLFKEKNSNKLVNKINIKNIIKIKGIGDKKFTLTENFEPLKGKDKSFKGKVYKFRCGSQEERNKWVVLLINEINKFKDKNEKNKFEIPSRKKVIVDHFKLDELNGDMNYMREKVLLSMDKEKFFKPSKRKLERIEALKRRKKGQKGGKKGKKGEQEESMLNRFMTWFVDTCDEVKSNINDYFNSKANEYDKKNQNNTNDKNNKNTK
jgi:hypothetical protein